MNRRQHRKPNIELRTRNELTSALDVRSSTFGVALGAPPRRIQDLPRAAYVNMPLVLLALAALALPLHANSSESLSHSAAAPTTALGPFAARSTPPARVLKVLTHYLDRDGRHTVNPSLFDRDAYQFDLRRDPKLRSGLRFDVLWKGIAGSPADFDLKLELRGSNAPEQSPVVVRARAVSLRGFSQWTRVSIPQRDYEALGELLAWRVTLWRGDTLLAEQTSFLW